MGYIKDEMERKNFVCMMLKTGSFVSIIIFSYLLMV